jgi:hypothetical protein
MDTREYSMGGIFATVGKTRVEVLDVYEYLGQKKALVKATTGDPFVSWTHGGYGFDKFSRVYTWELKYIANYAECECKEIPNWEGMACAVCRADAKLKYGDSIPFGGE